MKKNQKLIKRNEKRNSIINKKNQNERKSIKESKFRSETIASCLVLNENFSFFVCDVYVKCMQLLEMNAKKPYMKIENQFLLFVFSVVLAFFQVRLNETKRRKTCINK